MKTQKYKGAVSKEELNVLKAQQAADEYIDSKDGVTFTKEDLRDAFIAGIKWLYENGNESSNKRQ